MKTFLNIAAIFLLAILCTGALYGSWLLISDPGGDRLGIPVELLYNTPFKDYFIPGIILLIANGLFPVYIIVSILRRHNLSSLLLLTQGAVLTGWLTFELILNKDFYTPVLHLPLYSLGVLLAVIGFIQFRLNKGF